ncbi:MAG TPA: hypothetical protein VGC18_10655, partial [Lacisediminihabitans sp.]|uniref:AraC-like ligand-binding domain-containing protein n=1 Tax=Lacisediminihabitans sp. TaxID=2787631 RepID=UPI002ED93166
MFSLSSIPESVRRGTPQAALASYPLPLEPAVTLHLLTDGSLTVRHGDRTAELVPGSMLFTSTSEPLVMSRQDRCDMTTITVPVARLRLPARVLRRTQARVFTPADPVVASGALLLQRLAQDAQAHPESDWSVLEQSMIELMRAL